VLEAADGAEAVDRFHENVAMIIMECATRLIPDFSALTNDL
jgi:hypothetical protein